MSGTLRDFDYREVKVARATLLAREGQHAEVVETAVPHLESAPGSERATPLQGQVKLVPSNVAPSGSGGM